MKLNINVNGKMVKRVVGIALILGITCSLGSSYVVTEAPDTAAVSQVSEEDISVADVSVEFDGVKLAENIDMNSGN